MPFRRPEPNPRRWLARTPRSRRCSSAAVVVVAALIAVAVGCSSDTGPFAGPSATSRSGGTRAGSGTTPAGSAAPDSALPGFTPEPITDWSPCGAAQAECGTLEVPLDYDKPDGRRISLAVKRLPATEPADRIGSLFVNPGGPGASGVDAVGSIAGALGSEVRRHFDVVSWDPRGIGESAPLDCESGALELYQEDLGLSPTPAIVDQKAEAWADLCEQSDADLLPFVGTVSVAKDLEALRVAVGDDQLSYAGFSYGTLIGLVYAELFPTHIRALLLDGVVDPTLSVEQTTIQQSAAVEDALNKFIAWCDGRDTCRSSAGTGPAIDQIIGQARTQPVTARVQGKEVRFSTTMATFGLVAATYESALWPTLGQAIKAAAQGDPSALAVLTGSYLGGASSSANLAVNCVDAAVPTGAAYDQLVAAAAAAAPRVGAFNANLGSPCPFWGAKPTPVPTSYRAAGSAPIQVWGTTGDNATPYVNAEHVASILEHASLATLEADRHTAVGANACVIDAQAAYLIDLEVAPDDTRC